MGCGTQGGLRGEGDEEAVLGDPQLRMPCLDDPVVRLDAEQGGVGEDQSQRQAGEPAGLRDGSA